MKQQYYKIITYGCQMNENDSEKLSKMVQDLGYSYCEDEKKCDLILMNTCSVRENANDRFFGNLGMYKHIKEKINPDLILGVCGCMMQQEEIVEKLLKSYKFVDLLFGTHNLSDFPALLTERLQTGKSAYKIKQVDDPNDEGLETVRQFPHKALVKIMSGCDNFCSYCIVPYTRGREKSRTPENILAEVEKLAKDGVKEIMLLGQNVNSYGKGLDDKITFPELLEKVSRIPGIERIRFMTSHPKDLSDELIDVIAKNDKICPHVHLPVQSGSDKVLKDMNRHYTKAKYLELVEKMERKIKDLSLTTDIIVGFPTETNEDFEETLDLVKRCRFDNIFTFLYSKRNHTKAKDMVPVMNEEEIKANFNRLLYTQKELLDDKNQSYEGKILEVIVDQTEPENQTASGRSANNMLVNFQGDVKVSDKVFVKITKSKGFYLIGEIVPQE